MSRIDDISDIYSSNCWRQKAYKALRIMPHCFPCNNTVCAATVRWNFSSRIWPSSSIRVPTSSHHRFGLFLNIVTRLYFQRGRGIFYHFEIFEIPFSSSSFPRTQRPLKLRSSIYLQKSAFGSGAIHKLRRQARGGEVCQMSMLLHKLML